MYLCMDCFSMTIKSWTVTEKVLTLSPSQQDLRGRWHWWNPLHFDQEEAMTLCSQERLQHIRTKLNVLPLLTNSSCFTLCVVFKTRPSPSHPLNWKTSVTAVLCQSSYTYTASWLRDSFVNYSMASEHEGSNAEFTRVPQESLSWDESTQFLV